VGFAPTPLEQAALRIALVFGSLFEFAGLFPRLVVELFEQLVEMTAEAAFLPGASVRHDALRYILANSQTRKLIRATVGVRSPDHHPI
jgi:hypothetical protein